MNVFLKISLVLMALAFGVILWQGGHGTTITYLGVAPLVLWGLFLLVRAGIGFFKDKRSKNVNSLAVLALLTFPLSERAQVTLLIVLVFVWVIGRTIATAPRSSKPVQRSGEPKPWYIKRVN